MIDIKIRFNTENTGNLVWRVLIDNEEHLAEHIEIKVPVYTSKDILPDGKIKYHISCTCSELIWNEKRELVVK